MQMRNMTRGLILVLALSACGFKNLVKQGDLYATTGDWYLAYDAYQLALAKKPDHPGVVSRVEDARSRAIEGTLQRADGLLTRGAWVEAIVEVRRGMKLAPNGPRLNERYQKALVGIGDASVAAAKSGDLQQAYRWLGEIPPEEGVYEKTRMTVRRTAREIISSAMSDDRYRDAERLLGIVRTSDPSATSLLDLEQSNTQAWVSYLAEQTDLSAARGRLGSAVLYANGAAVVSQNRSLARVRDELVERLETRQGLKMDYRVSGRAASHEQELSDRLRFRGVRRGVYSRADIKAHFRLSPTNCTTDTKTRAASHEYQSGVRTEPNPEWVRLDDAARMTSADLRGREAELRRMQADYTLAQRDHEGTKRRVRVAQEALVPHVNALNQAKALTAEAAEKVAAAQAKVDAAQASQELIDSYDAERRKRMADLDRARADVTAAASALDVATAQLAMAQAEWDAMTKTCERFYLGPNEELQQDNIPIPAPCADAKRKVDEAQDTVDARMRELSSAEAGVREANDAVQALKPPTEEDYGRAGKLAAYEADVTRAQRSLDRVKQGENLAQQVHDRAAAELKVAETEEAKAGQRVAALDRGIGDVSNIVRKLAADLRRVEEQASRVPRTVQVPVMSTHPYVIETVRRTCTAAGSVATNLESTEVSRKASSSDERWRAVPRVGLKGKNLRIPKSDEQLRSEAERDASLGLAQPVFRAVRAQRDALVGTAIDTDADLEDRSRSLVLASILASEVSIEIPPDMVDTMQLPGPGF